MNAAAQQQHITNWITPRRNPASPHHIIPRALFRGQGREVAALVRIPDDPGAVAGAAVPPAIFLARQATMAFDAGNYPWANNPAGGQWSWGQIRRITTRFIYVISNNWPTNQLMNLPAIQQTRGVRMRHSIHKDMVATGILAIARMATGFNAYEEQYTLEMLCANVHNGNQIKICFIYPILSIFIGMLDPHAHRQETIDTLMNFALGNAERRLKNKIRNKGYWSRTHMENRRLNNNILQHLHSKDCAGLEFTFMRILEQVSHLVRNIQPRDIPDEITNRATTQPMRLQRGSDYDPVRNMIIFY